MTRDEIDATLAVLGRREGRRVAGVKQLALIVANQEERLRALEQAQENERERLAGADW